MRKLQYASLIILFMSILGVVIWRFIIPLPDWLVRVIGVIMVISLFTSAFSSVKIAASKR